MTALNFTVGSKLWFVGSQSYHSTGCVTVEKVGRVWATLSNGRRARLADAVVDGEDFNPPGVLWASREEHAAHVARAAAWERFCQQLYDFRFSRVIPEHATVETVAKCRELLGIPERT